MWLRRLTVARTFLKLVIRECFHFQDTLISTENTVVSLVATFEGLYISRDVIVKSELCR